MLPSQSLRVEWSLNSGGILGYVFNYAVSKLSIYHLEDGERLGPDTAETTLTSNDWGVLNLMVADYLNMESGGLMPSLSVGDAEGRTLAVREDHAIPDCDIIENKESDANKENGVMKMVRAVWESKSCSAGRWFCCTMWTWSCENEPLGPFVIQRFNSDCEMFQTTLYIPVNSWLNLLKENCERITSLFQSSRCWRDSIEVQRNLTFS